MSHFRKNAWGAQTTTSSNTPKTPELKNNATKSMNVNKAGFNKLLCKCFMRKEFIHHDCLCCRFTQRVLLRNWKLSNSFSIRLNCRVSVSSANERVPFLFTDWLCLERYSDTSNHTHPWCHAHHFSCVKSKPWMSNKTRLSTSVGLTLPCSFDKLQLFYLVTFCRFKQINQFIINK